LYYPEDPYDTSEKHAEAYRLIEKFQKMIDANEETKRFDAEGVMSLYYHQIALFSSSVYADLSNIPKLQAWLETLEKKNEPQLNDIIWGGYRYIWAYKFQDFSKNGGSNDDLTLVFDTMMKFLDIETKRSYDSAGSALRGTLFLNPMPYEQCTPEQQGLFINRMEQVIAKMETKEKAWKDAGKPMGEESHFQELRDYIDFLRMPGTVVLLTGQTVDGKPFDIAQYRGKVVVLHFWATWCGPCIRRIPLMKELREKYHDRGFEVLGISYDFEPEKIQPFIDKHQLPYLSLFDKDRKILNRFSHGNSSIDCLFDREGKVIFYSTDDELKAKLAELFAVK
jgi:peroxiredoxin